MKHFLNTLMERHLKNAKTEVNQVSMQAINEVSETLNDIEKKLTTLQDDLQRKHASVTETIPSIHQTMTKLGNYENDANADGRFSSCPQGTTQIRQGGAAVLGDGKPSALPG